MPPPSLSPTPTILLPQLPPKTLVGIDLITFTSTANFHGIRDLPEGWHFLYTGTTESLSLRCGSWFYVGDISAAAAAAGYDKDQTTAVVRTQDLHGGAEIRIWKWDQNIEALVPLRADNDEERQEAMRHKANLGAVWQGGGLFRYRSRVPPSKTSSSSAGKSSKKDEEVDEEENEQEGRSDWVGLTRWLSPQLLSRVVGDPELDVDGRPRWTVTSGSTAEQDADHIPGLKGPGADGVAGEQEKELRFIPVDLKRTWREGAIGRERTEAAQDRSWALGDLIRRFSVSSVSGSADERTGEAQILGELQFTFLMVLTMMNFSCLEQWKRLLSLILTCRAAIKARETFFRDVLQLLRLHLRRCDDVEGGLFEMDGDDGGEFLRKLLIGFKRNVDEVFDGSGSMVKSELDELEKCVKEFGWELRREAIVRKGMLQLEDGEQVEMELNDSDPDEETGEYAPVVVDLEGEGNADAEPEDEEDVDMGDMRMQ